MVKAGAAIGDQRDDRVPRENGTQVLQEAARRGFWRDIAIPGGDATIRHVGDDDVDDGRQPNEPFSSEGVGCERDGIDNLAGGDSNAEPFGAGEGLAVGVLAVRLEERAKLSDAAVQTLKGEKGEIPLSESDGLRVHIRAGDARQPVAVEKADDGQQIAGPAAGVVEGEWRLPATGLDTLHAALKDLAGEADREGGRAGAGVEDAPSREVFVALSGGGEAVLHRMAGGYASSS
jgi:hypothetical protein